MNPETTDSGTSSDSPLKIGLCLSGGGFRATFFHLGLIALLRDVGLLANVQHVVSVSGGSILAADLALHWPDYAKPDRGPDYLLRVEELVRLAQADLRGRIVRRMLLGGWLGIGLDRRSQLVRHLTRFCGNQDVSTTAEGGPVFHFLATGMSTGRLWSFSSGGLSIFDPADSNVPCISIKAASFRLGFAVAASAAFPPLFPPLKVTPDDLGLTRKELPVDEYLTDGGVFDNLGLNRMRLLLEPCVGSDAFILASDASSPFDWKTEEHRWDALTRNIRASSIMMNRIAVLELGAAHQVPQLRVPIDAVVAEDDIDIGQVKGRYVLQSKEIQNKIRFVRTDLDYFSYDTIRSLVRHGYEAGLQCFAKTSPSITNEWADCIHDPCPSGWPDPSKIRVGQRLEGIAKVLDALEKSKGVFSRLAGQAYVERYVVDETAAEEAQRCSRALGRARHRRLGLWKASDWTSWLLLAVGATCIYAVFRWLL